MLLNMQESSRVILLTLNNDKIFYCVVGRGIAGGRGWGVGKWHDHPKQPRPQNEYFK
jgi:hypothetical protein